MNSGALGADGTRIASDIDRLASMVDPEQPGWTRRSFTPLYCEARRWLAERMSTAGLEVRYDAAANLIGRRAGDEPDLPPIVLGSHTDTVVGGGRFDGIAGVIAGLELARNLAETCRRLRHPLEVIDFTAEEPSDFGLSTVGSRAMAGGLQPEALSLTDGAGRTLAEGIAVIGGRPEAIGEATRRRGAIAVYLELHIEQGPVLEQTGNVLGAVTGIVGIRRYRMTVEGRPDHAGTTPMTMRHDALAGAAEMVLAVEAMCREAEAEAAPVVGTVGWLQLQPNAANVVPGRVQFQVEVRTLDATLGESLGRRLEASVRTVAERRSLQVLVEPLSTSTPVRVDPGLLSQVVAGCRATDPRVLELPSGAGHDANQMARLAPVGMIFVPSRDARSHCPEEFTELTHLVAGTEALGRTALLCDEGM